MSDKEPEFEGLTATHSVLLKIDSMEYNGVLSIEEAAGYRREVFETESDQEVVQILRWIHEDNKDSPEYEEMMAESEKVGETNLDLDEE